MDEQRQVDQIEPTYNSSVTMQDLPGAMDDREGWLERVREIRDDDADDVIFC